MGLEASSGSLPFSKFDGVLASVIVRVGVVPAFVRAALIVERSRATMVPRGMPQRLTDPNVETNSGVASMLRQSADLETTARRWRRRTSSHAGSCPLFAHGSPRGVRSSSFEAVLLVVDLAAGVFWALDFWFVWAMAAAT